MNSQPARGLLIVFEGLDQSGKQTQAELLKQEVERRSRTAVLLDFPSYETHIGREIGAALQGERDYGPDVMQLLYVANRYEKKPQIETLLGAGAVVICDRYLASTIAYGEAHGLDAAWLGEIQRHLPPPDLTILLDIAPETAAGRKTTNRDRFERDLEMLSRVRESYRRQAKASRWLQLDGERPKDAVAADVLTAVGRLL
ncbi:MAG TPA: dTMP kinase [Vicinamibacterales bacterium]|jgi:dTMP kinase|nr:dTMP kinase [Vicinamibacterales bacterium]